MYRSAAAKRVEALTLQGVQHLKMRTWLFLGSVLRTSHEEVLRRYQMSVSQNQRLYVLEAALYGIGINIRRRPKESGYIALY